MRGTWWDDAPDVIGGRDLRAGGSWLAVRRDGRFAAVTNVHGLPGSETAPSRGNLVRDFVTSHDAPLAFVERVAKRGDD
ncbi:MAG TPA: NRDE family protein, partial [Thermoanaerobaculia bacterium]|nr:NRDE family protein [Thermoanaerobaculia bacterium]